MELALLRMCDADKAEEDQERVEERLSEAQVLERRAAIQDKIRSVSRLLATYQALRAKAETARHDKAVAADAAALCCGGTHLGGRLALQKGLLWPSPRQAPQPQQQPQPRCRC